MAKYKSAFEKLKEGARSGNPESQYILATKYYEGEGIKSSYKEAFK
jgi:TPR repeat protein